MKVSAILRGLPAGCLALLAAAAMATPDVRVVGLFSDRAVVVIDGQQHILRVGGRSVQGVRLIKADSNAAVLDVDGERMTARLDGRVTRAKPVAPRTSVQVFRNAHGMYTSVGAINGLPVPFLVDTGASSVAMNADQARRLGIDFRVVGERVTVVTASGNTPAWRVVLDSVKLGDIEARNVPGVVIDGAEPSTTLLGMSFLNRLEISNDGQVMSLRLKY